MLDIFHCNRVHTGKWLIQQNEFWVQSKCAGNLASASLAAGELNSVAFANLLQAELAYEPLQPLLPNLFRKVRYLHNRHYILLYGQLSEDRGLLGKVAYTLLRPAVHWERGNILVVQKNLAPIRLNQTGYHIETGGLARSVRSKQTYNLSLISLYGDPFYYSPAAVLLNYF